MMKRIYLCNVEIQILAVIKENVKTSKHLNRQKQQMNLRGCLLVRNNHQCI